MYIFPACVYAEGEIEDTGFAAGLVGVGLKCASY